VPFDLSLNEFRPAIGLRAMHFRHAFGEDARFALDALASYAASLPPTWVRAHRAQYSPHEPRGLEELPLDELEDSVRELAHSDASIRLYNLEHTAEFRDVATALDAPVRTLVGDAEGGVTAVNLGVFVASPGAVTPAHPDRHHNLLLAVDGTKEVWVEDDPDARAHHLRVVDYIRRPQDGAPVLPPARSFVLEPGDGVYIPPYAFHWATALDAPAVGLSVGFSTPCTVRSGVVHDFDVRLRNKGMRPRPSRAGGSRENVKMQLAGAVVKLARARNRVTGREDRDTVPAGQEGVDG
jgi:quercetin dioxygenase-like cupin family protein